jgi:hypothetical protein
MVQSFIDQEGGLLKKLLLALLLSVGLAIGGAATASAATSARATPDGSGSGCPDGAVVCTWNGATALQYFTCTPAEVYENPESPITYIGSNCGTRVWLHQDADGDGLTYCINPGGGYDPPSGSWESKPGNLQVTSNTSNC